MESDLGRGSTYDKAIVTRVDRPALRDLTERVGTTLNKALHATEDANADLLANVLKGIDLNFKKGKSTIPDQQPHQTGIQA